MTKPMICCVTHPELAYCQDRFLASLKEQGLLNDAVFATPDEKQVAELKKQAKDVLHVPLPKAREDIKGKSQAWLAHLRNALIDYAKAKGAKEIIFCDANIMPPGDMVKKLAAHKEPIAAAVYLGPIQIKERFLISPLLVGPNNLPLDIHFVSQHHTLPVAASGLGCALLRDAALELRFDPASPSPDFAFCKTAKEKGLDIVAVCNAKAVVVLKNRDLDWPLGVVNFSFTSEVFQT